MNNFEFCGLASIIPLGNREEEESWYLFGAINRALTWAEHAIILLK